MLATRNDEAGPEDGSYESEEKNEVQKNAPYKTGSNGKQTPPPSAQL